MLEATLDHQSAGAVDGTGGTQFGEQELYNVLRLAAHLLANVGDVDEDGALVAFTLHEGRWDGVALLGSARKARMRGVELRVEASKELSRLRVQHVAMGHTGTCGSAHLGVVVVAVLAQPGFPLECKLAFGLAFVTSAALFRKWVLQKPSHATVSPAVYLTSIMQAVASRH